MPTIHNHAKQDDISHLVLLTGDPVRAKYFAENFLHNCKLVNSIRGINGFTGDYKGKRITIMGHGMGTASMGIYAYELFDPEAFDVDIIVRLGSCGSLTDKLQINDVLVVEENYSDSVYGKYLGIEKDTIKTEKELLELTEKCAKKVNVKVQKTKTFTSASFYSIWNNKQIKERTKCETIEMEAFALGVTAEFHKKQCLTLITVADTNDKVSAKAADKDAITELTPMQREKNLLNMFKLGAQILIDF